MSGMNWTLRIFFLEVVVYLPAFVCSQPKVTTAQSVKIGLNKKLDPKKKTMQTFNIDAQGFRKTRNENPPMWEIGVTS